MIKVVLVRHGESEHNLADKFTGWVDCDLTEEGVNQAKEAGRILREKGYSFEVAYTSILKRANHTLDCILNEMQHKKIPIIRSWMLNERRYGALEDLSRSEARVRYGAETVRLCNQDYYFRPPFGEDGDRDGACQKTDTGLLPKTESMSDAAARALSYWNSSILSDVVQGKNVLIVAHGNILRLLLSCLKGIKGSDLANLPIFPHAIPVVWEFDSNLILTNHYPLMTSEKQTGSIL